MPAQLPLAVLCLALVACKAQSPRAERPEDVHDGPVQKTDAGDGAGSPERPLDTHERALEKMRAGDYAAAVQLFEVVTRADPDAPAPWSNLCKAIGTAKEPRWRDKGLGACAQAVKLNPSDGNLHHVIGHIQKETDPEGAVRSFRKAVELNPEDAATYGALGLVLHGLKDGPGAIAAARRAAAIEPHIMRLVLLGQLLAIYGQCAEAEQVAARARAMGDAPVLDGTLKKWCGR